MFSLYNRRNIINISSSTSANHWFYPSVTCNQNNTSWQVISFIKSMPPDSAAIIMFHSILTEREPGWGKDKWFNSTKEFEKICKYLAKNPKIKVVTNKKLHDILFKDGGK